MVVTNKVSVWSFLTSEPIVKSVMKIANKYHHKHYLVSDSHFDYDTVEGVLYGLQLLLEQGEKGVIVAKK